MIKFIAEIEEYNLKNMAHELEHVATLIRDNWPEGRGWRLEGEAEKEPDTSKEDKEARDMEDAEISVEELQENHND